MRDRAVEAGQCLVSAAQLLERRAEEVVGDRVLWGQLGSLAQQLDGFRGTLELPVGKAKKAERIDVLRFEFQDLGISRSRVGDGAAPVHVQPVLQQTGRQRARHPAPRPINMRAIAAPPRERYARPSPGKTGTTALKAGYGRA